MNSSRKHAAMPRRHAAKQDLSLVDIFFMNRKKMQKRVGKTARYPQGYNIEKTCLYKHFLVKIFMPGIVGQARPILFQAYTLFHAFQKDIYIKPFG